MIGDDHERAGACGLIIDTNEGGPLVMHDVEIAKAKALLVRLTISQARIMVKEERDRLNPPVFHVHLRCINPTADWYWWRPGAYRYLAATGRAPCCHGRAHHTDPETIFELIDGCMVLLSMQ